MHSISPAYARWYNGEYQRSGAFWGGRFKNILVEDKGYFLELSRYIDLNMVRAGSVGRPEEWPWGGYRVYAYGTQNDLIDVYPYFLEQSFRKDIEECRAWYRQFVEEAIGTSRRDPRMSEGPFLGSAGFVLSFS
jgi:putative transposase